jgi:hypothetical protein
MRPDTLFGIHPLPAPFKFYYMKRSAIFLGVSTCLLAVVGFAASKFHSATTGKARYPGIVGYISSNTAGRCTVSEGAHFVTIGVSGRGGKAIVTVSNTQYTVKTQIGVSDCGQVLYTVHE